MYNGMEQKLRGGQNEINDPGMSACATQMAPQAKYEDDCRTHARIAAQNMNSDEQSYFLECMNIKTWGDADSSEML